MSEWISVKDRLPNSENKHIVCLVNNTPILVAVHDATFSLVKGTVSFYFPTRKWIKDPYFSDVTHWMPLPKAPEVKDED